MAINFTPSSAGSNGFELLGHFGFTPDQLSAIKSAGISIELAKLGVYVVKDSEGLVMGSVPLKGGIVTMAKSKKLGPTSMDSIKGQFQFVINKALSTSTSTQSKSVPKDTKSLLLSEAETVNGSGAIEYGKPPLINAVALLQAVKGTTPSSTYYVVSLSPCVKVAARYVQGTLSIRCEGSKKDSLKEIFDSFQMNYTPTYTSGHYSVNGKQSVLKAIGAFLALLPKEFSSIHPSDFIGLQ